MRDHILATLAAGSVPSRTMMQKAVYLLGRLRDGDLGFEAYLYGPYSREVQGAVEDLSAAGLIEETRVELEPWEPTPFDVVQYRYALTEAGRAAAEDVAKDLVTAAAGIRSTATQLGAWSSAALAVAAKLDHIRRLRPGVEPSEVPEVAKELGWRVTEGDVTRALRLLNELGLT